MSGTLTPTIAASPTTTDVASRILATMAALTGIATDYNIGSQIRTQAEALGSVVETQGFWTQAETLQGMLYGAMALFGVTPTLAQAATGQVTIATAFGTNPPPAAVSISIPTTTIVGSPGGVQFVVTSPSAVIAAGATGVTVNVVAQQAGALGNVTSGAITNLLTSVGYPLQVYNFIPTGGGQNQGTYSQAVAAFAAQVATLGLCSPLAVANAAIGVSVSGEICTYAACYEPWLVSNNLGLFGFTLYIDNGSGTASANLIAAVNAYVTGNYVLAQHGYRPVGVPFSVQSGTPIFVNVTVSGTLIPGVANAETVGALIVQAVDTYMATMQYGSGSVCQQPQISAAVSNTALGYYSSLEVFLYAASAPAVPVMNVSGAYNGRVILSALNVTVS